jgi:hypothetical protein
MPFMCQCAQLKFRLASRSTHNRPMFRVSDPHVLRGLPGYQAQDTSLVQV